MSRINRPPQGLQKLLGSQNFGENPREFLQDVRPTVELRPFFSADLIRSLESASTRSSPGLIRGVTFDTPILLLNLSWVATTPLTTGNQEIGFQLQIADLPGGGNRHIIYALNRVWLNNSLPAVGFHLPQPLVIPAGAQVGCSANYLLNTISGDLRVMYVDLG